MLKQIDQPKNACQGCAKFVEIHEGILSKLFILVKYLFCPLVNSTC